MGRTAITRGSLYNGSITMAIVHFIFSVICVLVGIYIMKNFSWDQVQACAFLLFAVVGILASLCLIVGLYSRSSVLTLIAFILAALEVLGFIVLFCLYFFDLISESKALMLGDQSFLMAINAIQIFVSLYFAFAYSRAFRYLFPAQEHSEA